MASTTAVRTSSEALSIQGAYGMVFVHERRTEQGHDAITGELVDGAFITMYLLRQDLEAPSMRVCTSSGSRDPASVLKPTTSANNTVTCLRSPSRALRMARILSARCRGV
jgi:hypothetical protein